MPRKAGFALIFAPETLGHLAVIEAKYHRVIRETIDQQLLFTPEQSTRNRKLLEQPAPFDATWELRFGPRNRFRVFYEVDRDQRKVWLLAVGVKVGNQLFVGTEEIKI